MHVCVYAVGDADGALRLSRGSTDGENQGVLEIVFNGRYGTTCTYNTLYYMQP